MGQVGSKVSGQIANLDLKWQWRSSIAAGLGMASGDVWSRKARRKMKMKKNMQREEAGGKDDEIMRDGGSDVDENEEGDEEEEEEPALVFKVSLAGRDGGAVGVTVRWMQGMDSVLFESFCGWLKRKVDTGPNG